MRKKLDILFQDEEIVVVNKPAGVLTIPGRSGEDGDSLLSLLNKKFDQCLTVHRLDLNTSGVICFAKTKEAHKALSLQFQNRSVQKIYQVLVDGTVQEETGEIDKPIAPHKVIAGKMAIASKGKKALTLYTVKERFNSFTFLEADIKTGRTHQIRLHFQSIGFPLSIDKVYGSREAIKLSEIKGRSYRIGKLDEERPLMSRSTLHASKLTINHPDTGEQMTFEAPLPKDFKALLNQLRKWALKRI